MIFQSRVVRTIRLGLKSLFLHKLRSALTTLGILCGVLAVIAMLAIGEGASRKAQEQIKAQGSTNIILESRKPPELETEQQSGSSYRAQEYGLTYQDAEALAETLPAARIVVPVREIPKKVRFGERVMNAGIFGTDPRYMEITGLHVEREGRFLVGRDVEYKRNVAVLGSTTASRLFPFESPLGKPIRIGKESFRVVGVLKPPAETIAGAPATKAKDGVFVPLSAARSFFGELTVKVSPGSREFERVQLHRIQVQVDRNENVLPTARALRSLMKRRHKKKDYSVTVPLEKLRLAKETARNFTLLLASIAGISLLVGGIGIMNVMLATVTERTREIGIRRALGAKRRHIISQFLVETTVLSCGGGLLGVLLGFSSPWVVAMVSKGEMEAVVTLHAPLLAFFISAAVGILAGIYPALRAAQMDPVEALRHE